jgi:hypothetical protein
MPPAIAAAALTVGFEVASVAGAAWAAGTSIIGAIEGVSLGALAGKVAFYADIAIAAEAPVCD